MHYVANVTQEGKHWLATFPDAPGCQTFASSRKGLEKAAREALIGWLEAHLLTGQVPPRVRLRPIGERIVVAIPAQLAIPLQLRWARTAAKLTQSQLATKSGLKQQQIARLEKPNANPTIETLTKVAAALGSTLNMSMRKSATRQTGT